MGNYSEDEIKMRFKVNIDSGNWDLTSRELNILLKTLSMLPRDIIDNISKSAFIVALSLRKNNKQQLAGYLRLSEEIKKKKGIIFLSPLIFANKKDILFPRPQILHEIAHHILGHTSPPENTKRRMQENEAEKLMKKWLLYDALNT